MNVGVAILRVKEGLDCSGILGDVDDMILKASSKKNKEKKNIVAQTGKKFVKSITWFSVSIHINRFHHTIYGIRKCSYNYRGIICIYSYYYSKWNQIH